MQRGWEEEEYPGDSGNFIQADGFKDEAGARGVWHLT